MTTYIPFEEVKTLYSRHLEEKGMIRTAEQFEAECALLHQPFNAEIEQELHKFSTSTAYARTYGRFIVRSPRPIHTIEPHDFLQRISSPGQSFIVSEDTHAGEDKVWTHGSPDFPRNGSVWPLSVEPARCQRKPESKRMRMLKADVTGWTYAAIKIDKAELDPLFEAMVTNRLNPVAVSTDHYGAYALLRVDADSYARWRDACQEYADILRLLGMAAPEFRLDTLVPIPTDLESSRLAVYLA